jgi:hypothetical protein
MMRVRYVVDLCSYMAREYASAAAAGIDIVVASTVFSHIIAAGALHSRNG